jgi:VanZ family protein
MIRLVPLVLLAWTAMVVYLTLSPSDFLPETSLLGYDKLGHFGMFGGWTGLIGLLVVFYMRRESSSLWPIWVAGMLFSLAIELAQWGLPLGRSAEWADMVANALGCTAATGIIMLLRGSRLKKYLAFER